MAAVLFLTIPIPQLVVLEAQVPTVMLAVQVVPMEAFLTTDFFGPRAMYENLAAVNLMETVEAVHRLSLQEKPQRHRGQGPRLTE
jgi:hypothetical protein